MRIANFNLHDAGLCALKNVRDLHRMVEWNSKNGVRLFRMPSEIFPYADHPVIGYKLSQLPYYRQIRELYESIGQLAIESHQRLTSHPGPFTTLSSSNENIVTKSIRHLDQQAEIGTWLSTPDLAINIHIGQSRSDSAASAFVANFKRLGCHARSFLTVENDDKDNAWAVEDLVHYVYQYTGVPVVFDSHHWLFCRRSTMLTSARLALSTWPENRIPKMHYSESLAGTNPRAHSSYLASKVPEFPFRLYDLMLETKAKDLALLKYIKDFGHASANQT
jgi:UV DNA damage endonuclease